MNRSAHDPSDDAIDALACDWVIRRDTGLSPAEAAELAAWQAADPRHAAAVARHAQAWSLLDRPRATGRDRELERALSGRSRRRKQRRLAVAAVACSLLLVLSAAVWRQDRSAALTEAVATAVVREPERRTLADGSKIELKPGAAIAVRYTPSARAVVLERGEALFQIAKDPARPFVVVVGARQVRAVGTEFVVERNGSSVDVIVTEGTVAVENVSLEAAPERPVAQERQPAEGTGTELAAGGRARWDNAIPGELTVEQISPEAMAERLLWRAARLEFSDTPLAEALRLVNRHSATQVRMADRALEQMPVTGVFRAGNTDTFIRLLEANFGVVATRDGNTVTLRRSP